MTQPAADRLVRRAPFSDNPTVGPRGRRTQQRILDAALHVFGESGFHAASIDQIARRAGCSRVSFYQYFAGKDDVFGQLAAQVARQVVAATDALDSLTPDAAGYAALHAWVVRYSEIYERSAAVFRVFHTDETDSAVVAARSGAGELAVSRIQSKLRVSDLPRRELDAVVTVLLDTVGQTLHLAEIVRGPAPEFYPRERIHTALADLLHRALFGRLPAVNEHPPGPAAPAIPISTSMLAALADPDPAAEVALPNPTLDALLAAGREVFPRRGFAATRVDDIAAAAGLSHGAFYRYFANLSELALVLVRESVRPVSTALADIPLTPDRAALRRWLRQYTAAQAAQAAMIRVWVDASLHEPVLAADSAGAIEWGRRRTQRFLAPRGFGDTPAEAIVMVALLDALGAHDRPPQVIDAVAHVIERGLLGVPG